MNLLSLFNLETILLYVARRAAALAVKEWNEFVKEVKDLDGEDMSNEAKRSAALSFLPARTPNWAKNLLVELAVAQIRLTS